MSMRIGLILLGLGCLAGCGGGDDVARDHIKGTVQYDGKPVPAGRIYFDPAPGNSGPQGFTDIKDGKYDTRQGKGAAGGAMIVRIEGFDGQSQADRPMGNAVFTWSTKVELPKGDAEKDFAIKASEAKKVAKSTGPGP